MRKQNNSKPSFEAITPNLGSSFYIKRFDESNAQNMPRFWHKHPELELVLVNNGNGKRHIGNHIGYYTGGDLVLIGSNLPHSGFRDGVTTEQRETVIQFLPDFLGPKWFEQPEFAHIAQLFEIAKRGIAFSKESRLTLSDQIEQLIHLEPLPRLLKLIELLDELAQQEDFTVLNADGMTLAVNKQDNDRMRIIFQHIKLNYHRPITLQEVANLVALTEPSFSRYFKQSTGQTFTQFVTNYRLVHASKLLAEDEKTISEVALESGFQNFSHFTRSFKAKFGQSAKDYRHAIRELIE